MIPILDLFCGAGLVADGLIAAGFAPVGVDIKPQPRYPGPFFRADFRDLTPEFLAMFPAVWASPPCLRDTAMKHAPGAKGDEHEDLITPTRALLAGLGVPYVIENVETAPLIDPVILCGSHFALTADVDGVCYHLKRHRKFETNWPLIAPTACGHYKPVVTILGAHARVRAAKAGGRGTADFVGHSHRDVMGRAMGIPGHRDITCNEISQGIPPVYAEYVGMELMSRLRVRRAA